jgi:ATP-dependent Lon protease
MTVSHGPQKRLPQNPSEENLRKRAKRLARDEGLQLADAQHRLAAEYGYKNWADLMRAVASRFIPLLPLRELVAFPHQTYPIFIGRQRSLKAIEAAEGPNAAAVFSGGAPILMVTQRDGKVAKPSAADVYEVGTFGTIVRRLRLPDGTIQAMIESTRRARVIRCVLNRTFFKAEAEEIAEPAERSPALASLVQAAVAAFDKYANAVGNRLISDDERKTISGLEDPAILSDRLARYLSASYLRVPISEQQALLEIMSPSERLAKVAGYFEALP